MTTTKQWSENRRSRNRQGDADAALALCARHLYSGALTDAGRAAALAHQLIRLEAALNERQIKRNSKASIERYRAGLALEEARKAVASLQTSKTQS